MANKSHPMVGGERYPFGQISESTIPTGTGSSLSIDWSQLTNAPTDDVGASVSGANLYTKPQADGVFETQAAAAATYAPLASPALTGNPTAPTQTGTDNSTKLATTAFVQALVAGGANLPLSGGTMTGLITLDGLRYHVTLVNDADYTATSNDQLIVYIGSLTANRVVSVPTAASNIGQLITVWDQTGNPTTHIIEVGPGHVGDTVNGVTNVTAVNIPYGMASCIAPQAGAWICQSAPMQPIISAIGNAVTVTQKYNFQSEQLFGPNNQATRPVLNLNGQMWLQPTFTTLSSTLTLNDKSNTVQTFKATGGPQTVSTASVDGGAWFIFANVGTPGTNFDVTIADQGGVTLVLPCGEVASVWINPSTGARFIVLWVSTGVNIPVPVATVVATAALPANTNSHGTLTGTATGTLTVDGHLVAAGDILLLPFEATAANNGLYTCVTAGAVGVAYVLSRHVALKTSSQVSAGATVTAGSVGTTNGNTTWILAPGTYTVDTTALTFSNPHAVTQAPGTNNTTIATTAFVVANSGSGVTQPYLVGTPDVPPGSAATVDDEFTAASLAGKWTWLNQAGGSVTATATFDSITNLTLQAPTLAGNNLKGVYQAISGLNAGGSSWAVSCKLTGGPGMYSLANPANHNTTGRFGILLYESGTGKALCWGPGFGDGGWDQAAYATVTSAPTVTQRLNFSSVGSAFWPQYLRVSCDGTNYHYWVSFTGRGWYWVFSVTKATNFTTAADKIGLAVDANSANGSSSIVVDWFRDTSSIAVP